MARRKQQSRRRAAFNAWDAATTAAEIIDATACFIWHKETREEKRPCPDHWKPAPAALAEFIAARPQTAQAAIESAGMRAVAIAGTNAPLSLVVSDGVIAWQNEDGNAVFSLETMHALWRAGEMPHPLTPVVQAWMRAQPQPLWWTPGKQRILSTKFGEAGDIHRREKKTYDLKVAGVMKPGGAQLFIPGVRDDTELLWPSELFYLGGVVDAHTGWLAERMFNVVTSCADAASGGIHQRLEIMPRDMMNMLYKDRRLNSVLPKMEAAAHVLHNLRVPVYTDDGGVGELSVITARITAKTPNMPMVFEVNLPRGSMHGAPFDQIYSRDCGLASPVKTRVYWNTRFMIYKPGETLYPKRYYKDGEVRTVWQNYKDPGRYGKPLLTKDGKRAVSPEAREILWRIGHAGEPKSTSVFHNGISEVIARAHETQRDGRLIIKAGRFMPPPVLLPAPDETGGK